MIICKPKYNFTMQTKLTLELERDLIERAERHAEVSGKSVSQLVADCLALLGQEKELGEGALPPITRSLSGILEGAEVDEAEYYSYLEQKHI